MERIFLTVVNMSINAGYVILVVLLARLFLKKAPKIFSYALWFVVLFRLLCPVTVTSSFGILPADQLSLMKPAFYDNTMDIQEGVVAYDSSAGMEQAVGTDTSYGTDFIASSAGTDGVTTSNQEPNVNSNTENNTNSNTNSNATGIDTNQGTQLIEESDILDSSAANESIADKIVMPNIILPIMEAVWLIGILVIAGYSSLSLWKVKRSIANASQVKENIYEKDGLTTPFVVGLFSPRIYLPTGLMGEEREYILAHERMHMKRLDHVVKLLAFLTLILHWMNPLVWLSFILLTKDMEMSCDEAVIRRIGMDIKKEYSVSLLNMATEKPCFAGTPIAFGEGNVKGRIKNILYYKKAGVGIIVLCITVVALISIFSATNRNIAGIANRIKVTRQDSIQANTTELLQDYELSSDVKSYMIITSIWQYGEEMDRNCFPAESVSTDSLKGQMNLSVQYIDEADHRAVVSTGKDGNYNQSMTYFLTDHTMRAGNILESDKYTDITLNKPYPIAVEYIGGSKTTQIEAIQCSDLMSEESGAWQRAKQQMVNQDVSMLLIYFVASDRTPEELQNSLEQMQLIEETYPASLEQMYQWRTEYIGDNSAVGNITDAWFTDEDTTIQKNGFELQTETEPYEVTVQYVSEESSHNAYIANVVELEKDAALFFSLVHNAGIVNISINDQIMESFTRVEMEEKFGDLWSMSEDYEGFCQLYDVITDSQSTAVSGEEDESTSASAENTASLNAVMDRLVETIGTDNALPFNHTADILPDKDALIKLCVSQDGKYEAYGCISPEYGFQGIILNDIIDGESNHNYLYEEWKDTDMQPQLITLDQEQYQVALIEPVYVNGVLTKHIRYFTGHDTGTLTEQDKPEVLLPEEDIFKISVTNGSTGEKKEYSRLDSNTGFLDLLSKYEGIMVETAENKGRQTSGYQYAFHLYDSQENLLQTFYLMGNEIDVVGDTQYQEAGIGSIDELYLVADSLFTSAVSDVNFFSQTDLKGPVESGEMPGVQMSITYSTDRTANVVLTNTTEDELLYGGWFRIEKKENDRWQAATIADDNIMFKEIGYNLSSGGIGIWRVNWSDMYGKLPAGEYRIIKSINYANASNQESSNAVVYISAEFSVQ